MPRRREVPKRPVLPDPKFHEPLVTKFINTIMRDGKRSLAEGIFYGALDIIQERTSEMPLPIFTRAVENVKPVVEVRSRRVGGSTYQIPVEVRPNRRLALSMRWLIIYAKQRSERTMRERLAAELLEAANNAGAAMRKRDDTHRMADANKAFAHYKW